MRQAARGLRAPATAGRSAAIDVDGQAGEVIQLKSLRILPTGDTPDRQQEGLIRRVGETRTPVRYMALVETAKASSGASAIRRTIGRWRAADPSRAPMSGLDGRSV